MRSFWPGPLPCTSITTPAPKIGWRTRAPRPGPPAPGASPWPRAESSTPPPPAGAGGRVEGEGLRGAGHAHVAERALLLDRAFVARGRRVGEHALLQSDHE